MVFPHRQRQPSRLQPCPLRVQKRRPIAHKLVRDSTQHWVVRHTNLQVSKHNTLQCPLIVQRPCQRIQQYVFMMNLPPWRETTRTRTEVFVKVPKLDQREDLQFNKRWFPLPNDLVEVFWVEFNDVRRRCSRSKRC